MSEFEKLLRSLSSDGRDFERVCGWYLENAPEYRAVVKRVWPWMEWPGRWGADAGIDLVVETHDGDLWAVQAKHYNPAYAIKKADLDSFLSESSRPGFTYRLLISSTDHVGATARRTLDAQEKQVGTVLRSDLAMLDLDWPQSMARLRPAKRKPKKPWPYQRRAVKDVVAGLSTGDRGQLVMACGTGKALAARFLHDSLESKRTLVLVPSLSLVKQTIREWFSVGDFDYLAVCSDETVARDDRDAVVGSTSELGIPVTTDPAEIASFLRRRESRSRVVFATYQSSQRIADAQVGRTPWFDLVIADEAHRCAGPEAGVFATVLDPAKIKGRKRLFMTATPRYFTGRLRREASEADWEIASMDDETKFGPVLHRLAFAQAIKEDLLSDYQVVVVGVSDSTYLEYAQRGVFVTADGETITDARTLASQLGLLRAMAKHDLNRVVTFHSRIRSAREFATSLHDVWEWMPSRRRPKGKLWTQHVSGEMSSGEREVRLNQLREVGSDERGVLTNARCLTEGVDVPTLDGVAFIDPRRSQVDIVQAVGRAIRKAKDKTLGTIIIPVFVDASADSGVALDSSEFKRVWDVVRALRSHDDDLAEQLDALRREQGRRGSVGGHPSKIVLDLPTAVTADFARAFDTRLVETATESWEFWFGLLERLVTSANDARVPVAHIEDGHPLGTWANDQRKKYRRGEFPPERAARLEALPGWVWSVQDAEWEEGFSALERFVTREGHARIPEGHKEDGYPLRSWATRQRSLYGAGRLSSERISRLEAIPGWVWEPRDAAWEKGFSILERFATDKGHPRVTSRHMEDGYPLGAWVAMQRHRASDLSPERAARLEALPGWAWRPFDANWEEGFSTLERFVAREGNARVKASHTEDGYPLGTWVGTQRSFYRSGVLSPERVARLEALPGWVWNTQEADWEEGFSTLERLVAHQGTAEFTRDHVEDGHPLGSWATTQRVAYRADRLSPEHVSRLEAIPGWVWNPRDAAWETGFSILERFVADKGHARVLVAHTGDGYPLGTWVNSQRRKHRNNRLSPERVSRLEALPGWTWNPGEKTRSAAPNPDASQAPADTPCMLSRHMSVYCNTPECNTLIDEPIDLPNSERKPCPNCGSLSRHVPGAASMPLTFTASSEGTVERALNEIRLAVLGILAGIALTVGFGVQAAPVWRVAAGGAAFVLGAALIGWRRSRRVLMAFMNWLTDR